MKIAKHGGQEWQKAAWRLRACLAALCCVVLWFASVPLVASAAAENATFGLVGGTAAVGEEVQVRVTVNPNTHICNFTMKIFYDPSVLEYVSCAQAEVTQGGLMAANAVAEEQVVKIAFAVMSPITSGGDMFILRFRVLKDQATGLSMGMNECDGEVTENGQAQSFEVTYTLGEATINAASPSVTQGTQGGQTTSPATVATQVTPQTQYPQTVRTNQNGEAWVVATQADGTPQTQADGQAVTSRVEATRTSVVYVTQADGTQKTDAVGQVVTEVVTLPASGAAFPVWAVIGLVAGVAAMGAAGYVLLHNKKSKAGRQAADDAEEAGAERIPGDEEETPLAEDDEDREL